MEAFHIQIPDIGEDDELKVTQVVMCSENHVAVMVNGQIAMFTIQMVEGLTFMEYTVMF